MHNADYLAAFTHVVLPVAYGERGMHLNTGGLTQLVVWLLLLLLAGGRAPVRRTVWPVLWLPVCGPTGWLPDGFRPSVLSTLPLLPCLWISHRPPTRLPGLSALLPASLACTAAPACLPACLPARRPAHMCTHACLGDCRHQRCINQPLAPPAARRTLACTRRRFRSGAKLQSRSWRASSSAFTAAARASRPAW